MNPFAGWQISVTRYKRSIYKLISAMCKIYPQVLPANRKAVIRYFQGGAMFQIDKLLRSTHGRSSTAFESTELRRLVQEFTELEEGHLTLQLQRFRYNLHADYVVFSVTGHGRIERVSQPSLFINALCSLNILIVYISDALSSSQASSCGPQFSYYKASPSRRNS